MHTMVDLAKRMIANWRRKRRCCRYITLVIEGDDEVYELVYPKDLSKGFVEALARRELARQVGAPLEAVHVTQSEVRSV